MGENMNIVYRTKKIIALLLILFVAVVSFPFGKTPVFAKQAEPQGIGDTYDYFANNYKNLENTDNVFKTVRYYELQTLLGKEGNYVILFGGAWDSGTQTAIGYINEVAKEYGVEQIYNFDSRLDGKDFEIADNSYTNRNLYVNLISTYLTNLTSASDITVTGTGTGAKTVKKPITPFLFVYNKDNPGGQIVSYYEGIDQLRNDVSQDEEKINAYKAKIRSVLEPISTVTDGKKTANASVFSLNDYHSTAFAGTRYLAENNNEVVLETITYDQFKKILGSKGNYAFVFAGAWCTNTQPIINLVNQYAKKYHIKRVYSIDTHLEGAKSGTSIDIRTNNQPVSYLYGDLVNEYLKNLTTQNSIAATPTVISYTDLEGQSLKAARLQVPFVFTYNKDHKDKNGNPAPILGSVELMYTASNIYPETTNQYKKYTASLDNLYGEFTATLLNELTARAQSVDQNLYTAESYNKVKTALENAKAVVNGLSIPETFNRFVTAGEATTSIPERYFPDSADITSAYTTLSSAISALDLIQKVYAVSLSETGTYTFPGVTVGYTEQAVREINVHNNGNQSTGALNIALSGRDSTSFVLSKDSVNDIAADSSNVFTVAPKTGLEAGTYTATVTVSGNNGISESFHVTFTVNPESSSHISLSEAGTYAFPETIVGYTVQTPLEVEVHNNGEDSTGELSITLSGRDSASFELSQDAICDISACSSDFFTVIPKTGLEIGTYTATVTVSGSNSISASFDVSFTVVKPDEIIPLRNGWINDFYYKDGVVQKNVWVGNYYTDENGKKTTDAVVRISGKIYAFNKDGIRQTGTKWVPVKGKLYRIVNGYVKPNIWVGDYRTDKNGARIKSGKINIGSKTYIIKSNKRQKGNRLVTLNNKTYYVTKSGTVKKNAWIVKSVKGKKQYYRSKPGGEIIKSRKNVKIGNKRYTFDKNGVCKNR